MREAFRGAFPDIEPVIATDYNPDGTEHQCQQINIHVTLPNQEPFGIVIRAKLANLLSDDAEMRIWAPATNQIRQELEFRTSPAAAAN